MGEVMIEGKPVTLPDDVIAAGTEVVRQVLVANGFPAAKVADIQIRGGEEGRAPSVHVAPRSQGKGSSSAPTGEYARFIQLISEAPPHVNPAILLAAQVLKAEAEGDEQFIERASRSGQLERAVMDGLREGRGAMRALQSLRACKPVASKVVPVGF